MHSAITQQLFAKELYTCMYRYNSLSVSTLLSLTIMSISYFNNAHPDPDVANGEQSSFHIADGIGEHKKASRQRACVVEVTVLHQLTSTCDSFVSVQRLSCCFEPKSFLVIMCLRGKTDSIGH